MPDLLMNVDLIPYQITSSTALPTTIHPKRSYPLILTHVTACDFARILRSIKCGTLMTVDLIPHPITSSTIYPKRRIWPENEIMATAGVDEVKPPSLTSTSDPPSLFDGTTRLYISYACPFAQRVWISRNYKGQQDNIKLVPIDLQNRPAWYKEKVYPENKVPSLEHNGKVLGESLDLIRYVDANFAGPALFPDDPAKKEFGEQLLSYSDTFRKDVYSSLKVEDPVKQTSPSFDYLENALGKFDDGPFFLGQFSGVDVAYAPFAERFQIVFSEVFKHDITEGRTRLRAWFEELNKNDAYVKTKSDPQEILGIFKKRFLPQK